jgi:hypothetical protein
MALVAAISLVNPRVVVKPEYIYLIYENPYDEHPMIETRVI